MGVGLGFFGTGGGGKAVARGRGSALVPGVQRAVLFSDSNRADSDERWRQPIGF